MKQYVKCSHSSDILNLTNGLTYIIEPTWSSLIDAIESETDFSISSEYVEHPQKHIFLYDSKGNEYEAEITKYFDGDYELRFENVNLTGWNQNQRHIIRASEDSTFYKGLKLELESLATDCYSEFKDDGYTNDEVLDEVLHWILDKEGQQYLVQYNHASQNLIDWINSNIEEAKTIITNSVSS